jgi:serine/threonine-protein phosphatase 6 regulatory subunit 3
MLALDFYANVAKQDPPEVHANAAEILSAVTRCAPPALAVKISSPRSVR